MASGVPRWLQDARDELCGKLVREQPVAKVPHTLTRQSKITGPRVEVRYREQPACNLSHALRVCRGLAINPILIADLSAWIEAAEKAEAAMANSRRQS